MSLHDSIQENLANLPSFQAFVGGDATACSQKIFQEFVIVQLSDKKLIDLNRYAVIQEVAGTGMTPLVPILQSTYGITLYSHVKWRESDPPHLLREPIIELIDITNNICAEFINMNLRYLSIVACGREGPISIEASDEVGLEEEIAGLDKDTTQGRLVTRILLKLGASSE